MQEMSSVEERLSRIEASLLRIEAKLEAVSSSCTNMDDHIDFVENVYSAFKRKISFFLPSRGSDPPQPALT